MKPKVYITDQMPDDALSLIAEHFEYEIWDGEGKIPKEELMKRAYNVVGIINDMINIDSDIIDSAPMLRVVCNMSVGYNNLDLEAMKRRNIMGTNTPEVLNDSVADLVVGLMLATARRITEMDHYVKSGNWLLKDYKSTFGVDVHHATVGIIGMGRIGEVVAKRLTLGFDAKVLYFNRTARPEVQKQLGVTYCEMEELLRKSDFIVLMTPLNSETKHLMGERQFSLMKNTAIFINASRGGTVDEQALIQALKAGQIRAAGLDVFEKEPVEQDNELLTFPNVVTLPHLGTATEKTTYDMAMLAAKNLIEALLENDPSNLIPELKS